MLIHILLIDFSSFLLYTDNIRKNYTAIKEIMMKKIPLILLCSAAAGVLLTGCGAVFA